MGTYCSLSVVNPDCTVTSIVVSNNGYLSYMTDMLLTHYQDRDRIKKVINCGNISHLVKTVSSYDDDCFTNDNTPAILHQNFQEYCDWLNSFLHHNYFMDSSGKWMYLEKGGDAVLLRKPPATSKWERNWKLTQQSFNRMWYSITGMFEVVGGEVVYLFNIWRG